MAISIVSSHGDTEGTPATTFTFTRSGATPVQGNLLVAFISKQNAADQLAIVPDVADGWSELLNTAHSFSVTGVFWKIAGAVEDNTFDFVDSESNARWAGGMLEISGFDPSDPIDVFQYTTGVALSPFPAPSALTTNDNELVISGAAGNYQSGATTYTVDGDLVERWNEISGTPTFGDIFSFGGTETQVSEGESGTYSHESDGGSTSGYLTFTMAITNGSTVVNANANSQTFTAFDAVIHKNGVIAATITSMTFTALDVTVGFSPVIPANILSMTFTALDATVTFIPTIFANVAEFKFEALSPVVDGFYVGPVVPGIWPNEIEPTGSIGES